MTYYSLKILEYPEAGFVGRPDGRLKPGDLVQELHAYAHMCGSYAAAAWAKARHLEIHYVDNCWVYVAVDSNDLEDFMADVLEGKASPDSSVVPGSPYLLMAEEY